MFVFSIFGRKIGVDMFCFGDGTEFCYRPKSRVLGLNKDNIILMILILYQPFISQILFSYLIAIRLSTVLIADLDG